jgi:hypothetical protein
MTDAEAARPAWKTCALWALVAALLALIVFGMGLGAGIAVATQSTAKNAGLAVISYPLLASPVAGILVLVAWVLIVLSFRRREAERAQTFRFAALGITIVMTLVVGFLLFAWVTSG